MADAGGIPINAASMEKYCHPWLLKFDNMVAAIPDDLQLLTNDEIFGLKEVDSVAEFEHENFLLSTHTLKYGGRYRKEEPVKEVTKRKHAEKIIGESEKIGKMKSAVNACKKRKK